MTFRRGTPRTVTGGRMDCRRHSSPVYLSGSERISAAMEGKALKPLGAVFIISLRDDLPDNHFTPAVNIFPSYENRNQT